MAKKKKAQAVKDVVAASAKETAETIAVRPVFDMEIDSPVYYVNHIEVASTRFEFSLICGRVPTKLTPKQVDELRDNKTLRLVPILQMLVSPTLVQGLIDALTLQKKNYEKAHGTSIHKPDQIALDEKAKNARAH